MITGALQKTFNTTLNGVIPICSCQRLIISWRQHTIYLSLGTQSWKSFSVDEIFVFVFCQFKFLKKFLDPFPIWLTKCQFREKNKCESKSNQCIKCIWRRFGCLTYLLRKGIGKAYMWDLSMRNTIGSKLYLYIYIYSYDYRFW